MTPKQGVIGNPGGEREKRESRRFPQPGAGRGSPKVQGGATGRKNGVPPQRGGGPQNKGAGEGGEGRGGEGGPRGGKNFFRFFF